MDAKLETSIPATKYLGVALEWALVLVATALFTITESYQPSVTVGLGLLAVFFAERGVRGKLASLRSGMEGPVLLFIISAAAATAISYNSGAALLQFARILAAAALFFIIADSQSPVREMAASGFLLATAGLAVYWPLKNDFTLAPGKLGAITDIGQWLNAHIPTPPGPEIHSNVAAGVLLVGIPFGVALTSMAWRSRKICLERPGSTADVGRVMRAGDDQQPGRLDGAGGNDYRLRSGVGPAALVPVRQAEGRLLDWHWRPGPGGGPGSI